MALTELKSILSNFRRPMNSNPLDKKGKDKVEPVKTSTKDETLSRTSNLAPISSNKSGGDLTKTHLKSFIKTVKLGVFDAFSMPKLNSIIAGNKNEFSNIQITKEPAGTNNNSSTVDITRANNGTDNNTSPVYVTNSVLGKNNNSSDVKTVSVLQDRLLSIMNSGLDVDNIPVKYVVSGKLLTDISDINIDYNPPKYINTPSMLHIGSTGPGSNASILDIDTIPLQYQVSGKLLTDISTLNIDSIPLQYQVSGKLLTDISTLNIDSIPLQYQVSGKLLTDISTLNIDSIPTQYQVSGKLLTDISTLNIDSIPTQYKNIVNLGQFNPFNTGQSQLDINSVPNKYIISGKLLTDTSVLNIDSIPTQYQNIVALGQFNPDKPGNSILDIDTTPTKYSLLVGSGRLNNDNIADISNQRWSGLVPPAVNFFRPDVQHGAKGFTTYFTDKNNTQFVGVDGLQYGYTDTIQLPLTNTKYPAQGIAGLSTQLGAGSIFNYIKDGAPATKQFSKGYSSTNTYGSIVLDGRTDAKNSPLYLKSTETNSPSALDELYSKYNLQDDSYNPWYIPQPFVLRGIQRKGNKGLQRWGGSALADDGLIRAGMAASVERSAFDVARLSQWIASPKGLLWVTKQVGLGFSNPKVEHKTPLIGQTRIHTGITSLLSVPTTAFGLHLTRHGLPFLNSIDSYENVLLHNRLSDLKENYFGKYTAGNVVRTPVPTFPGGPSLMLSGIGGPNSAYGLGYTLIRRVSVPNLMNRVQARLDEKYGEESILGGAQIYTNVVTGYNSYALKLYSGTGIAMNGPFGTQGNVAIDATRKGQLYDAGKMSYNPNKNTSAPNPFKRESDIDRGTQGGNTIESADRGSGDNAIKNYSTLMYSQLTRKKTQRFQDFREDIDNKLRKTFSTDPAKTPFSEYNLEKFGWGDQGKVGENRDDFTKASNRGDKVNQVDAKVGTANRIKLDEAGKLAKGDYSDIPGVSPNTTDFIAFYFAGPKHHKDGAGDDMMVFRANIQGFSDSFAPEWTPAKIMGRADSAYIYTGFDRNISFTFTVAATSREEMKPMWRKLNYLATYTMPDYGDNNRMVGPFMRITLGNLFQNTPGFIESLSVAIPDEATWEINQGDTDKDMLRLPMMAEVNITFKVLADYRPQKLGRAYSLSPFGKASKDKTDSNWLYDSTNDINK